MTAYVPSLTEKDPSKLALAIQQLTQGRSNAIGTFTLAASASSTTVSDKNCAAGSVIIPVPTSAAGATELGNGTMFLSGTTNGTFTFVHANSATPGRTFAYAILG